MYARRLLTLTLLGLSAQACCCCPMGIGGEVTPEDRARMEERREAEATERREARERAVVRGRAYASVAALIDPAAAVPTTECPDDEIEASRGGFRITSMYVPTVDYGSLPGVSPPTPEPWRWLGNDELQPLVRAHREPETAEDHVLERAGDIAHRYLAVFVGDDRELPVVTQEPGILRAGQWRPGSYRGGVYMVDLDAGRVICSTPFTAQSTEGLDVGDDDLGDALLEDFQSQVEARATDALQEHTVHFNLDLVGFL